MAGSNELQLGLRLTADPSNLRAGTEQGVRDVRRLTEQTQRSGQQSRAAARETRQFSDQMRNAASASAVLHGPLGGVASRFSSIATLASRAGLAMGAAGLAASGGVMAWLSFTRQAGAAERELLRLESRLQATSHAAGVSTQEINAFARQLAEDTLTSVSAVRQAAAELTGFSGVTRDHFFRVLELAQDLGGDLTSNVRQLAQVLEAPEEGLGRLARRMSDLTFEQRQMIIEMIESGRHMEAQSVLIEHIAAQIGGSGIGEAAGLAGAVDTLGERWTRLKENLGDTGYTSRATQGLSGIVGYLERISRQSEDVQLQTARARRELTLFGRFVDRDRLDAEISNLEARQESSDPETLARAQREAEQRRALDRILEIESEAQQARVNIERSTNDQIIAERDRMLRELEGLAGEGNAAEVARAQAAVRLRAAAAIEAAERPAREAAERRAQAEAERAASQAQANRAVIQGMQREYELVQTLAGAERERAQAMDAAAARMNEFASPAQVAMARELAASIHDALQAEERRIEIAQAGEELSRQIAQQQLLAQFAGQETQEYRIQAELLDIKHRLGDAGVRQLEQQVRLAEELSAANQAQAEAFRALQNVLDTADPSRALQRQLDLIEELKQRWPEYADELDAAAARIEQRMVELERNEFAVGAARGMQRAFADLFFRPFDKSLDDMVLNFVNAMARIAAEIMATQALTALFGGNFGTTGQVGGLVGSLFQFHGGGVVGSGGTARSLGADEMLTVLRRGEEVLTTDNPRHRNNEGNGSQPPGVTVINTLDAGEVTAAGLATPAGEKVLYNFFTRNRRKINQTLGN